MSEFKGLVSISIPVLNGERFLAEAVESVLAQTYPHWELFIVDDGSSDKTTEIAHSYPEKMPDKIFCLEHPGHQNRGLPASRNLGAIRSRGEFLAFIDSDDTWLPEKLAEDVSLMRAHPEAGLLFGRSEYWYDWNQQMSGQRQNHIPSIAPGTKLYTPPTLLVSSYPFGIYGSPCPSSFFARRDAFDRLGGFVEHFNPRTHQLFEDIAFLTKSYLNVPILVSSACMHRYRCSAFSMTESVAKSSTFEAERRFFFEWQKRYLREQNVLDPEIWRAVRKESWFYSLPIPDAAAKLMRRIQNKIARTLHPESVQS